MITKGIEADALDSIYSEAILFVVVFGLMSIVSIIISKRNAKKYEEKNSLKDRKIAKKEEALQKLNGDKIEKISELSKMLQSGIIDEDEFKMLKKEVLA